MSLISLLDTLADHLIYLPWYILFILSILYTHRYVESKIISKSKKINNNNIIHSILNFLTTIYKENIITDYNDPRNFVNHPNLYRKRNPYNFNYPKRNIFNKKDEVNKKINNYWNDENILSENILSSIINVFTGIINDDEKIVNDKLNNEVKEEEIVNNKLNNEVKENTSYDRTYKRRNIKKDKKYKNEKENEKEKDNTGIIGSFMNIIKNNIINSCEQCENLNNDEKCLSCKLIEVIKKCDKCNKPNVYELCDDCFNISEKYMKHKNVKVNEDEKDIELNKRNNRKYKRNIGKRNIENDKNKNTDIMGSFVNILTNGIITSFYNVCSKCTNNEKCGSCKLNKTISECDKCNNKHIHVTNKLCDDCFNKSKLYLNNIKDDNVNEDKKIDEVNEDKKVDLKEKCIIIDDDDDDDDNIENMMKSVRKSK